MAYTAKTVAQLRMEGGSLLKKIASELGLIETALGKADKVLIPIQMSFDVNGQTTTKIYVNDKVTVNKIRSIVMEELADTDAGTITASNSTGAMANGVVTVAASAALNEEDSASPTTNNVIAADSYIQLATAKTTPGGKVYVTIECTRTA